jgi:hypothetical protein
LLAVAWSKSSCLEILELWVRKSAFRLRLPFCIWSKETEIHMSVFSESEQMDYLFVVARSV